MTELVKATFTDVTWSLFHERNNVREFNILLWNHKHYKGRLMTNYMNPEMESCPQGCLSNINPANAKIHHRMLWARAILGFACIHFKGVNAVIDWLFNWSMCSYLTFSCFLGSARVGSSGFLFFSRLTKLNGENSDGGETGQHPGRGMFCWPLIASVWWMLWPLLHILFC